MDKYSAVYFVKNNEVLVIGDLTTHLCSCSSIGACGAALGLHVVWGDATVAQLLGSADVTEESWDLLGGMRRGSTAWESHCLGNEWLVIPSCSSGVPSAAHRCPMLA